MSKNIKRDENGCPILDGAILYGYSVRPKSKRTNSSDLKSQASDRLLLLLSKGAMGDRLARPYKAITNTQEHKAIEFQKEYAAASKIERFAFHNNKLNDLREELKVLESSENQRKLKFMKPILEREIEEQKQLMCEIYQEMKRSK